MAVNKEGDMAVIWKVIFIKDVGLHIPVKVYDESNTIVNLCDHRHRSHGQARRCLIRNLPRDLKYQRTEIEYEVK